MDIHLRQDELELLNLNPSEKKIIITISKMGKSIAMISRHTDIPRTSILYMLKKLQQKEYVKTVQVGKRKHWRSNIPHILRFIKNLQNKKH